MAKRYRAIAYRRSESTRVADILRDAGAEPLDAASVTDVTAGTRAMALVVKESVAARVEGALPADALIAVAVWEPAGKEALPDKPEREAPSWSVFSAGGGYAT